MEKEIQNTWIGKTSYHYHGDSTFSTSNGPRRLLKFEKDSVISKDLFYDFITDTLFTKKEPYRIENGKIINSETGGNDPIEITISNDSLSFLYFDPSPVKVVYEKLQDYNLASRKAELFKNLTSSSFLFPDSNRVEFRANGFLIFSEYNANLLDYGIWKLDTFENELFLIFSGFNGDVIHISKIGDNHFKGIIYSSKSQEVIIKKHSTGSKFDLKFMEGEWEEFVDPNIPKDPLPPKFDGMPFFENEYLYFQDSLLIKKLFHLSDTFKWETNREQDLLLFPGKNDRIFQNKWKIVYLNEDSLVIDRVKVPADYFPQLERKILKKMN
jgi:hypothetical protein